MIYAESVKSGIATELEERIICRPVIVSITEKLAYERFRVLTPSSQRRAEHFIREYKPDIIHVHYGVDMLPFASVLAKMGIPVVVSFYGYDCTLFPKRFMGLGKQWLEKKVFRNPSLRAVFAMSPDMRTDLLALGCPSNLIRIHYYGSECARFHIPHDYSPGNRIKFCIISGLTPKKGHGFLLQAWKKMNETLPVECQLDIYGDGELRASIEKYVGENGLVNVVLHGPLAYGSQEHMDALKNADVFVHPSITAAAGDKEGIPGAVIEAMAAGLPVVTTYHAGIPYVVQHEYTGLLVEENHIEQLAEAMARLCNDPSLRELLGRNAQSYATSSLDVMSKEAELEALYDEAISISDHIHVKLTT